MIFYAIKVKLAQKKHRPFSSPHTFYNPTTYKSIPIQSITPIYIIYIIYIHIIILYVCLCVLWCCCAYMFYCAKTFSFILIINDNDNERNLWELARILYNLLVLYLDNLLEWKFCRKIYNLLEIYTGMELLQNTIYFLT